ncbi:MAG: class I SAM-dependent methyltransferase [Chlorobium sp.]
MHKRNEFELNKKGIINIPEEASRLLLPCLDGPYVNWMDVNPDHIYTYSKRPPDQLAVALAQELQDGALILDYGCGAGRHLRYFSKLGFSLIGIDPGLGQLEVADQAAPKAKLEALHFGTSLVFPDASIDGALSTWSMYHATRSILDWSIYEILRVLKPGAPFFFNLISTADFKYGAGIKLEKNTYTETRGGSHGELHHFVDLYELNGIVNRFSRATVSYIVRSLTLEPYEDSVNMSNPVCAHWLVKAWK